MASKARADKKARSSKTKTKKAAATTAASTAPKIINAKGGLAPGGLTAEILATMEDDLRISKAQAKDFVDSLVAVVEQQLQEGKPVNLFHLVKLVPRYHTKGTRDVFKVFGDPESGKVKKNYPAKVSLALRAGTHMSRAKAAEILPNAAKMARIVQ